MVSFKTNTASKSRRRCFAVVVGALAAWAGEGKAQPLPGVDVRWVAPATCPSARDLSARVRRLLGAEPAPAPRKERLVVVGTVVRANGRYRLSLEVRKTEEEAGATRTFESESCESLAGAAAVTIALLARGNPRWDEVTTSPPSSTESPSAGSPPSTGPSNNPPPASTSTPAGPTAPASATPTVRPPTAAVPPPERSPSASPSPATNDSASPEASSGAPRRWAPVLSGPLLIADEGTLPFLAFGLGVGLGIRVGHVEALLNAFLWLPGSAEPAETSPYAARYERRSAELSGCYGWPQGAFELGPCLMLAVEDVTATGTGARDLVGGPGHPTWMTVGVAARARWAPSRWSAFFVQPRVALNASRPTYMIEGVGTLYSTPLATVGMDLGCEWIF